MRQLLNGLEISPLEDKRISIEEAVQWAEEHLFDRNSVVLECQVWQEALGRARGEGFSVSELKEFTQRRGYIRDADRPAEVTLRDVLLREWEMVQTAKEGVGDCHPLCGLGNQADKLAEEYLRLAEQNASAVVVSQTWGEVHRVNSRVRDALKAKGLLGANDTTVQVLDRLDLTKAQKRDERFYPQDAVIVFNQKVREAEPGSKGKLAGILKSSVLVEVGGKFVTVSNKMLDRISVCQSREQAFAGHEFENCAG